MELVVGEKRKYSAGGGSDDALSLTKRPALNTPNERATSKRNTSRTRARRELTHDDYTVGWVCALSIEGTAAVSMLDEEHEPLPTVASDTNTYTFGNIGRHNVVICRLPDGHYGTNNAATVATHLQRSFPRLRIRLMVGIGGGVPGTPDDVRLGDIVVGRTTTQYDFGKELTDGTFEGTSLSVRPPQNLMTALSALQTSHERTASTLSSLVTELISQGKLGPHYSSPGRDADQLFDSRYGHEPGMDDCLDCDRSKIVHRVPRLSEQPKIHYGHIASGNKVIKSAKVRDDTARKLGALCFEMEAAGLVDHFQCLVIRGICDYCDSHKLKNWQRYAAAVAAAYAREFILIIPESTENTSLHLPAATLSSSSDQKTILDQLPIAEGASFDSRAQEHDPICLENTRVEVLGQITDWATSIESQSKSIFWLSGMAGTGKSTISRTIAQSFAEKRQLYASFFFKRGEADRGNLSKFFTTIAASLIVREPSTAHHIKAALETDPLIPTRAARVQFEELFQKPLANFASETGKNCSALIIIDALDECEEDDIKLLFKLFSPKATQSKWLKIFITSRPDLPTRVGFSKIKGSYKDIILHEIADPVVERDITIFLEDKLADIRNDYNASVCEDRRLPLDWPSRSNIESLARLAAPLFIFAATICRFVSEYRFEHPAERLSGILNYRTHGGESHLNQLDGTYMPVLNSLTTGLVGRERAKALNLFQTIIGPIITLAVPLSTSALSQVLDIPKGKIDAFLDRFHSVLSIPSSATSPVRLLHLSFRDFLVDPEKGSNDFWIDEEQIHKTLAEKCLRLLRNLKHDICEVKAPGTPRSAVSFDRINQHISPEIQYSCLYWTHHLQRARRHLTEEEQREVYDFLTCHFLHWIEALSLIGRASEGIKCIKRLHSLNSQHNTQLSDFLQDAARFLKANYFAIDSFPLQIYSALLIFAPRRSRVRLIFEDRFTHWIYPKPDVDSSWDQCLLKLEGHSRWINTVAFSHDSSLVASGSDDKTIRIWSTDSGECIQKLEGHSESVRSVAFSHDSNLVASGSNDNTIRIWSTSSGECIQKLEGHSESVISVAFSYNSNLVASGSVDKTIRIWSTDSGECIQRLKGHSESVISVAFSHDLNLVASGSHDDTIRIWSTDSGECIQKLEGHREPVISVAFSYDSSLVASGSNDNTIRIWSTNSGGCIQRLKGHSEWVTSVAFSHNSCLVASGSDDKTTRIWSTDSGECVQRLKGHSKSVNSVAFSHDSSLIASGSHDDTIRIWSTDSGECIQKLEGHSNWVNSVAFSYDSSLVASGSDDTTIRIWSTDSGECVQRLAGHSDSVRSVAFSHASSLIASGSYDNTIRIWSTDSGECINTIDIGVPSSDLLFNETTSFLHNDIGSIFVGAISPDKSTCVDPSKQCKSGYGIGIGTDKCWITWNGSNVLWLPLEARPSCTAISKSRVAIGCGSGRVLILGILFQCPYT